MIFYSEWECTTPTGMDSNPTISLPHLRSSVKIVASKYAFKNKIDEFKKKINLNYNFQRDYKSWIHNIKNLQRKGVANLNLADKEIKKRVPLF